ncbi:MAG: 3-hydroxyacyl-ACP dehydratase FabZ [Candidatus Binatia bacterium]|nr:3-hydroxyacyl-ACP dehydratase FabZ [Candidatus Binatia bacterium]
MKTYEIAELLPHRYPFCFVDRVLDLVEGQQILACKNVSFNEPYFPGHFPDQPVMPGVLICEALAQAAALIAHRVLRGEQSKKVVVLSGIDSARFRRPVLPGDQLILDVKLVRRRPPLWKFQAVAKVDGHVVAEAELLLTETEQVRL